MLLENIKHKLKNVILNKVIKLTKIFRVQNTQFKQLKVHTGIKKNYFDKTHHGYGH